MKFLFPLALLFACSVSVFAQPVAMRATNGTAWYPQLYSGTNHGAFVIDQTSGSLALQINTNIVVTNQMVGIGTPNPVNALHILGSSVATSSIFRNQSTNSLVNPSTTFLNDINHTINFTLLSSGASGSFITTMPDSGVFTGNTTNGLVIAASSSSNTAVIRFSTGGSALANERMRVDVNGLVGINTTTPSQRLDVNGSANIWTNLYVTNLTGFSIIYGSGALTNAVAIGTFGLIASNAVGSVQHLGGNTTNTGTGSFTTGVGSYATDTVVNIAATGWTNTFGKNAVVYLDGTAVTFTVKNNAGTPVYTNAVALTGEATVILQPGGAVTASGTGVAGRAVPF